MSLWPFRRKTRRKRVRAATVAYADEAGAKESGAHMLPPRTQTGPDPPTRTNTTSLRRMLGRQSTEPNKLRRRTRSNSFSPGREDKVDIIRRKSSKARRDPRLPFSAQAGVQPTANHSHSAPLYGSGSHQPEDKEVDDWRRGNDSQARRIPSLYNKRDGEHLPRKLSSKRRRKNDDAREAEIKGWSNFTPLRPATDDWNSGRPMKKDSKRLKRGFGGGSWRAWDDMNPSSDISLPIPESMHSSLSTDSEFLSFKVSALDVLVPRPTLRYQFNPRWAATPISGAGVERTVSQRRKLSEPIPEATLKAHKRVDDLADQMDARELREMLERDQRRRERKRLRDQEKMERKLARRAERHQANEQDAAGNGEETRPNLERGVLGREMVGLGIEPASAVVTSTEGMPTETPHYGSLDANGDAAAHQGTHDAAQSALEGQPMHQTYQEHEETQGTARRVSSPPRFRRLLGSKKSRSTSPPISDPQADSVGEVRHASGSGGSKGPLSWSSIFWWTSKSRQSFKGPSSFSNTSRDSMHTTQLPAPPVNTATAQMLARGSQGGPPKRTKSRFREDLPELPATRQYSEPPAPPTRVDSGIADAERSTEADKKEESSGNAPLPLSTQSTSHNTASSQHEKSLEAMRQTPSTLSRPDDDQSPEPQTMSLASIDSEGSWLSGRLGGRRRSPTISETTTRPQPSQEESNSYNSPSQEADTTVEEQSIADDEYLSRFAHSSYDRSKWNRKSTGEARPSSDEEGPRWGNVKGQQPTVIENRSIDRMKSRECVLASLRGDDGSEDSEMTDSEKGHDSEEQLQRATSVSLGKGHSRTFSAGSAKLLELSPRASIDRRQEENS
ncbi:hypothetical protein VTK73DRAFT_6844 [Phialemonium thermophilum]|uniref:Uncharacterized protein n=1 Tax=Phialemonium thermophilum TaxID=223376 RepID=A0ABR3XUI8_9PEZI